MGKKLLVIDDVKYTRNLIVQSLRKHEGRYLMDVMEAKSAEQAMFHFKKIKPDCVVCDIHLPDGNGLDLYKEMKKKCPEMPFVLITAYSLDLIEDRLKLLGLKRDHVITKPLDFKMLKRIVYLLMNIDVVI